MIFWWKQLQLKVFDLMLPTILQKIDILKTLTCPENTEKPWKFNILHENSTFCSKICWWVSNIWYLKKCYHISGLGFICTAHHHFNFLICDFMNLVVNGGSIIQLQCVENNFMQVIQKLKINFKNIDFIITFQC